jgi:hypothetical protein
MYPLRVSATYDLEINLGITRISSLVPQDGYPFAL